MFAKVDRSVASFDPFYLIVPQVLVLVYLYVVNRIKGQSQSVDCTDLVVHEKFRWQTRQKPITKESRRRGFPDDLAPLLLSYLDAEQLCRTACVSKKWFFISYTDRFWFLLCEKRFGIDPNTFSHYESKEIAARTLYMNLHLFHRHLLVQGKQNRAIPTFQ